MKLLTKIAASACIAAAVVAAAPIAANAAPAISTAPCVDAGFLHLSGPSGDICFVNSGTQSGMSWRTNEVIAGDYCGTVFYNNDKQWLDFSNRHSYGFSDGHGHALTVTIDEVVIFGC